MGEDNTNRFLKVREAIAKNLREMKESRARLEGVEVPVEIPPVIFKGELGSTPPAPVVKKKKKQAKKRKPADRW